MKFIDRLLGRAPTEPERVTPSVRAYGEHATITTPDQLAAFIEQGTGSVTRSGVRVDENSALRIGAAYRCSMILAGVIAMSRTRLRNDGTLKPVASHEALTLMNKRPNSWMSPFEFKRLMTLKVIWQGNGIAKKVRTGGKVTALIPLTGQVQIEQLRSGRIIYKHTTLDGRAETLRSEDVLHVRGPSLDGVSGMSILSCARETMGLSQVMTDHAANLFARGTNIGGVLQHPGALSEQAHENLRESLGQFQGATGDKAGTPLILEEGMNYQPLGMTSADAEFIEQRKFSVLEICVFFGVPPHMIGFTEKQTSYGQGVSEQNRAFVNVGLSDYTGAWEGALDRDLVGATRPMTSSLDLRHLTKANELETWQANQIKLSYGAMTVNEIREREDMPSVEGGDERYSPPNVAAGNGDEIEQEPNDDSES